MLDRRDGSAASAERLCRVCVDLLDVDGAALSLMVTPSTSGTYAADSALSRDVDAIQFSVGDGPGFESVRTRRPVVVSDLRDPAETRFPAFADSALRHGIRAVVALPVTVNAACIGALGLLRVVPGAPSEATLRGGLHAAALAALPFLDLMGEVDTSLLAGRSGSDDLESLGRVEIYQATGMLMQQLDIDAHEALARLRAHAYAQSSSASEIAWDIVERRLVLDADDRRDS